MATKKSVPLPKDAKTRIEKVLKLAAKDIEFRQKLLRRPKTALKGMDLEPREVELLVHLTRVGLEEVGVNIRKFRAFLHDNGNSSPALQFAIEAVAGKKRKRE